MHGDRTFGINIVCLTVRLSSLRLAYLLRAWTSGVKKTNDFLSAKNLPDDILMIYLYNCGQIYTSAGCIWVERTSADTFYARHMMPVTLYKIDLSPPARAAMMAIEIIGLPVEFKDVDVFKMEHRAPEYTEKNPLHTVPYLDDNGFIIHDSHAIMMYLMDVYGKDDTWYPKDVKSRTLVNQKLFFNNSILFPRIRNITYYAAIEGVRTPAPRLWDDVREAYDFMEKFLTKTKYLALDHMTIADIAAFTSVTGLNHLLPMDTKKYPKTEAWLKEMKKQPFVQKINEPGDEKFRQIVREKVDLESAFR